MITPELLAKRTADAEFITRSLASVLARTHPRNMEAMLKQCEKGKMRWIDAAKIMCNSYALAVELVEDVSPEMDHRNHN